MQFNNFDQNDFLKNYWEKKPMLIKGAVKNTKDLASIEDLMDLAMDPEFESRMIIQSGGEYPWQLKHGPFSELDFNASCQQTLICHRLNQLHNNFFGLSQMVSFLPAWQFDDVMATLSDDGASCGAHIDNYNVFILQGEGKRKWMLQTNPDTTYQEGLDVRLLKNFKPDTEYILGPGDMIYIPPKVAHHGVSIGKSISYSIGFKALDYSDLLDFYASYSMQLDKNPVYANSDQKSVEDNIKVTASDVEKIKNDFLQKTINTPEFSDALLAFLTRPTGSIDQQFEDEAEVKSVFDDNIPFSRDVNSQFLYFDEKLYSNSVPFDLSTSDYEKLRPVLVCDMDDVFYPRDFKANKKLSALIQKLLFNGDLFFIND